MKLDHQWLSFLGHRCDPPQFNNPFFGTYPEIGDDNLRLRNASAQ